MAKLGIREYDEMPTDAYGREIPVGLEPPVATQTLNIVGGVGQTSAPFNDRTTFIRVHTDAICNIDIGETPAAQQGGPGRMAASQTEHFGVRAGKSHKLHVITDV